MLKRRQSQLQKTELIDLIIARTNVVKRYMIGQKEAKSQAKDGIQTESRKIL